MSQSYEKTHHSRSGNTSVTFLARRVPDLRLHSLAVHFYSAAQTNMEMTVTNNDCNNETGIWETEHLYTMD